MTDAVIGAAPAAAEPAAIGNVQTAEKPANVMASIEKSMSEAYDKINPPRENGKFVEKDKPAEIPAEGAEVKSDAAPEIKDQNPAEVLTEPPKVAAIDPPQSWSAEMKAKWATLPPDVQAYASQREGEAHKRISELGQQVKAFEPFQRVYEPLRQAAARNGTTPDQGLERLLAANEFLDRDPASAIKWLAEAYGVNLGSQQTTQEPGQESGEVRALKAEIGQLKRMVGETASKVTARERSEQEQTRASLDKLVSDFSKDKTDLTEIESDFVAHISAIRHAEPDLAHEKVLEKAYEAARWANPGTRAKMLAEQDKQRTEKAEAEQKKKAAEAKKVGSLNVKSTAASPAKKGNWEATLREVGERIA
jgi:hypothetical protein